MLSLRDRIGVLCASAGMFVSTAGAIDGPRVPKPGEPAYDNATAEMQAFFDASEAICAVGDLCRMSDACAGSIAGCGNARHLNSGTGLLVAPNMVLTDAHVVQQNPEHAHRTPYGDSTISTYDCGSGPESSLVVRFRLNPDMSYGSQEQGVGSFYQVKVKRIIWPPFTVNDPPATFADGCPDQVILVLSDGPADPGFEDGWITHIPTVPLASGWRARAGLTTTSPLLPEIDPQLDVRFFTLFEASWGGSSLSDPAVDGCYSQGRFRYSDAGRVGTSAQANQVCLSGGLALAAPSHNGTGGDACGTASPCGGSPCSSDSGRPHLMLAEDGTILAATYAGLPHDFLFRSGLLPHELVWFNIDSRLDTTTSGLPGTSGYEVRDLRTDMNDLLAIRVAIRHGMDLTYDWSGSANPRNAAWGVPDGVLDGADSAFAADLYLTSLNPANPFPILPLLPGDADINGDGRFNQLDVDEQFSGGAGAKDIDGSGELDIEDFKILKWLLEPFGQFDARTFGHGVFGDLDGDDVVDCADRLAFESLLAATPDLFSYRHDASSPAYRVELDADLDGVLSLEDMAAFSPFDVATAGADITDLAYQPDGLVDRWDAMKLMRAWSTALFNDIGDVDGDGDEDADDRWAFAVGRDQCGTPTSDVFNWGLDANGDGRWDYRDIQVIQAIADASGWDPDWDLDGDTVITSNDRNVAWNLTYLAGGSPSLTINHGVLGDENLSDSEECDCDEQFGNPVFNGCYDGTFCPMLAPSFMADCTDLAAMTPVAGPDNDPFDGYVYGDASFRFDMDFDLDGDNDQDDWVAIFGILEPADFFSPDGQLTIADHNAYLAAFSSQDPIADVHPVGAPDGMINIVDLTVFLTWYDNGTGLCN